MSDAISQGGPTRLRRAPPPFRTVHVQATAELGARLRRVTLAGDPLVGFPVPLPGASVRMLVPAPGVPELVLPEWTGNEFLFPDGARPPIRTFTPRRIDPATGELDVDVVLHGGGVASEWARVVEPGATAAISGPGRGYAVDPDATAFLLAGDESALPAIAQLLEVLPAKATVQVHVEVAVPEGRSALPPHPGAAVTWHDLADATDPGSEIVAAVRAATIADGTRIWVAGEAASVQRVRTYLFTELGIPRARCTVRGYWKRGRSGDDSEE